MVSDNKSWHMQPDQLSISAQRNVFYKEKKAGVLKQLQTIKIDQHEK